ncbi:hypothetical protein FKR81_17515 [Lentzea tibetensis]|uniref:Abortive infection protein n=1 Tax=Lentzea tibetensis TaxID=2591470 RepID=A0A563ET27_9PSEU|nr:hypothetical protein [Lentzea tibetensis]TWP50885.1 hypothetical protein FKR81_17515 [Lentzea tibetensis]
MRAHGISYDTGFFDHGESSHEPFDLAVVARELRVISDELHCTAVRLIGSSPDRLEAAARIAAGLGMEVWICPWTSDFTRAELHDLLVDLAVRAERLRLTGAEVVLLTGAELSLLTRGFLDGDTIADRIDGIMARREQVRELPPRINAFLGEVVAAIRQHFGGKVSYASIPFEGVDWTPFDVVGVDLYRTAETAHIFEESVRKLVDQGKPVAITEFGCATFKGAADLGARIVAVIEYDGHKPVRLDREYVRDEQEQATCLRELLDVFTRAGVDAAFVFTFACYALPHRPGAGAREDLDLASCGIVTVHDDRSWTPKAAFATVAEYFRRD